MPNKKELIEENQNKKEVLPTEEEVRRLRQELEAKEAQLQRLREVKKEKMEVLFPREKKEEVQKKIEKEKEEIVAIKEKPSKAPAKKTAPPPKIKEADLIRDLQHVMSLPKPRQVKVLIYFAFKKGLAYAVSVAQRLKNPYLLDEFHDTLVDELYEILKKRRKI